MAYPQQPPPQGPWGPQGHQGYGPPPPRQGAPGYGPPPAPQPQPHGQYGYGNHPPPYGPPPGNRTNPVLIGVIAVLSALLLLGGGAVGAYAFLNTSAPAPTPTPVAQPSTPSTSAPPTSAPPTSAPPTSAPSTPEPSSSGKLDHTEFGNWNFSLKDEKYAARKVGGWNYDSCDPVDAEGVLADHDCRSAVQLAYTAYGGNLKAVQIILSFPESGDAKATANQLKNSTDRKVAWRRSSAHSRYAYGAIYSGAYRNYVVVTVVTANESAKPKARKFHTAMQTDRGLHFFMGREDEKVVTS